MKLKYILLFIACLTFTGVSAQTLDQARKMFTNGQYAEAKPVFARFVKSQPNNANYNYWYGVCLVETDEPAQAVKHLQLAHKRKVQNAPLYLGKALDQLYRFDEATKAFEDYKTNLEKKKQSTDEATRLLELSRSNARMLKGVEDVTVIDSFVVDKASFLEAYKISEESGSLYTFGEFFDAEVSHPGTVYETELKNKLYYSEMGPDSTLNIYSRNRMFDDWGRGYPLPGSINSGGNANYPFVLTDGITIYFASDGEGSMGGYDIFVTRYNSGSESYLTPENVGMPFNSPFNDYMYVIDEFNDLGWFATDRFQPDDKVCIYVFIPNSSKLTYNYEALEPEKIRSLARLNAIEDTWKDEAEVDEARKRLEAAIQMKPAEEKHIDFEFVINDNAVYYSLADFKSSAALEQFRAYQQLEKDFKLQAEKLASQRKWYAEADKQEKDRTAPAILDLEKRVAQMETELLRQAIKVRNEENNYIK